MPKELGSVIGIARRAARREPMEELETAIITTERGLEGDHKGLKFKNRALTILAREAWEQALSELDPAEGPIDLHWTTRRANLLVEGVTLPRARGGIIKIGPVLAEITYPTQPCRRMEDARKGLLKALHPEWRGGVCCRILEGGTVNLNDPVEIIHAPPEHKIRLPD